MKYKKIVYVFLGKEYLSVQRFATRKKELLDLGYELIKSNGRKLIFKKK